MVAIEKKNLKCFSLIKTKSQDGVNSLFQEVISMILKSLTSHIIGFQPLSGLFFLNKTLIFFVESPKQFF